MKKTGIFRRLLASAVAMSMIMAIGSSVFAQNSGALSPGRSVTTGNVNSSSRYYYTFTPSTTGTYAITAKLNSSSTYSGSGRITVYTGVSGGSGNESFSGQIANISVSSTTASQQVITQNLTANTTYYFRVRSTNTYASSNMVFSVDTATTTIEFHAGTGGSGTMDSITVPYGQQSTLPPCTFTRSNYAFSGWATSSGGQVVYQDGASITPNNTKIDLYAVWVTGSTITFHPNSGSGTMNSITVPRNQTSTLPTCTFTRENYDFAGWATSSGGQVRYQDGGNIRPNTSAVNLYAVWTLANATINFDAAGGTGTMESISVPFGQETTLPACIFTRSGYEFAGWALRSGGTVEYEDGAAITPNSNPINLYAVWNQIYTVSFDKNDGSGTTITPMTGTAGTTITLPSSGYTRWGYELIGWAESNSSTATILPLGSTYTITGNKTLYAVWGQVLSFNANNGTGSINPILARRNSYIVLPGLDAGISREGYTLVGWGSSSTSTNYRNPESTYQMPNSNRTLYAIWQGTLNFNSNGGTGGINPRALVIGATTSLPSAGVTRTGYGLRGWDTSATATTPTYRTGTDYTFTGNTTLYAVWGPTLTYNGNGGSGFIQGGTYDYNYQVQLSSNTGNQRYTRNNYTILGWARSADATAPEFGLGGTLTITEPTTLYAVWGRNLAFAPNGGTGEIPSILAVPGTTITLPETGFTRDGYTLAGWSIASDGTTKDYELGAEYTVTDGNVTLTAVWECTLSFDANGGTGDAMDDMTVIAGATVNLPACTYEYTTYSFAGWADTTTGTPSMTYTPSASTVMYAIWTARTVYNVNFDANGGEGTMASIPLTDDVTGTIPACEFTYTGFTFLGWTTDPESTTVDYVEGDPIGVVDSDVTLYALWSARDVYYVNFDANGGEGTMSPLALTDDVTGTIPACGFTRDGYTCIGWAVDADSETADYVQGDSIRLTNDNLTLYAVWEEGVTPGPDDPDDPDDPEVPDEPVYTPEQLREMNITHFVDTLYLVALERPYDVEGRDNWTNQLLVNGNSGSDIVYGFLNSQEFIGKNLSDEEYITILYRIFFDREPDAEGMANWKKALAGGATRNDILRGFADSPEWLAYCARYQVNP